MLKKNVQVLRTGIKNYLFGLDKVIILVALALSAFGVVVIRSAASSIPRCVPVQIMGICLGLVCMLIIARMDFDWLGDLSPAIVTVSCVLLLFTAFFGKTTGGNTNWISLGKIDVQPSEFAKAAFIVTMSAHLSRFDGETIRFKDLLLVCVHFLLYFVPIVLQKDIGSALIYAGVFVVLLFVAGVQYRYFLIAGVGILSAIPIVWQFLQQYQKSRIIYGFQPELDPLHYGYQPLVSRMALASGKFTGMGYMEGLQIQNDLLPAKHTDFIYAVVGEEFGFVGCVSVLAGIMLIVGLIFLAVAKTESPKGKLICIGSASVIILQTCINIGMVLGLSPVIGVTLPFMSYGGSSVLSSFIILGLVQSVRVKENSAKALQFGSRRIKRSATRK